MADNKSVNRSAAMSVKPRESPVLFPMFPPSTSKEQRIQPITFSRSVANSSARAQGIAETHVARADRCRQIHTLSPLISDIQTLSHHPHVDLLNQGQVVPSGDGIGLIRVYNVAIDHVVAELQVDDVVGDWDGGETVDLAHQAGSLNRHPYARRGNLEKIRDGVKPANAYGGAAGKGGNVGIGCGNSVSEAVSSGLIEVERVGAAKGHNPWATAACCRKPGDLSDGRTGGCNAGTLAVR